jgi:hypothetical protein
MHDVNEMNAATERINAGAPIAPIDPSLIERVWKATSRIPRPTGQHVSICLQAVASEDPKLATPDQEVAFMVRYGLLDALIERGLLDELMQDESSRKRVFEAAATLPCDKNDFAEAVAEKLLRDSPPEIAKQTAEELKLAGYDPNHLKIFDRFIAWIRDH